MARYRRNRAGELVMGKDEERQIPSGPIRVDFDSMMPGYRTRHDGWNQQRLQRFFDVLAFSGCIEDACRVCGMSDVSARRMKKKYPLFATAWEDALARAQQGLIAIAYQRAVEGRETVIIRKGEEYQRKIEPSDAMLGLLIKRGDMSGGKLGEKAEDVLTYEEWKAGWIFKKHGGKWKPPSYDEAKARLEAKFDLMRKRMFADADRQGVCIRCDAPLRLGVTNQILHDGKG
ncbi:MAG: hypothetical protein WA793_04915 [Sphingorhabdus sp.]|uniref:hypothetical protein n=1 Tax=Sphingorhabdus sp. TaxID=1902408 RepID=UPI003C9D469D